MNKNDLVARISESTGVGKGETGKVVDGVFHAIQAALAEGEEVRVVGFGTFTVAQREASQGRNPRTGEAINIPASKMPKFKPGKALKDALNA